jgi:Fe-S oxidoreductase
VPSPPHRALVGLGYPDVFVAADDVPEILACGPIGLEGFEGAMIDGLTRKGTPNLDLIPEGRGFLLAEFGGDTPDEADARAARLLALVARHRAAPAVRRYTNAEARAVWKIRESGPRAAGAGPGRPPRYEGWDDAAVAPARLGAYLRELRALLDEYGYEAAYYGHFGHGCIHMQVSFDLQSEHGIRQYGAFIDRAADLVVRYGGSISGEHGDGQARGALLPKMFGPELMQALREFKSLWDPDHRMNPGKLVDANPPTADLRLGADYAPREPATYFAFRDDGGSFGKAALRCIGLGECRKHDYGTMCPSFMATREEAHSTRGRARMLFEMLQGEAVTGGWQDEAVKQSLELCLSCKACKSECPTNVDLAAYKAEFLAHYYEGRRRPLEAHAFGRVDRWLRAASRAPRIANAVLRAPGAGALLRRLLRVAPQRELPRLAPETFRRGHRTHGAEAAADAVLWVDTFNDHLCPQVLHAAAAVLAGAGVRVHVPAAPLCCGRPLYDYGMLDEARQYLRRVLDALGPQIDAGLPVIVLEPSCASVFRDELTQLWPDDPRAGRLRRQTVLLSEFLARREPIYDPPRFSGRMLLHGHCHHKALMKMTDEETLLRRMGAEVETPDTGCCGMAGPFGLDAGKYAVAQAIGERVLLPAVRRASAGTVIVAGGFSCREQIRQSTGREALHLAEVLARARAPESSP